MHITLSHGQLWGSPITVWLISYQPKGQKLKSSKPVLRTVKRWTNEAEQDLKACFDLTDWSVLKLLPPIWTSSQRLYLHISVSVRIYASPPASGQEDAYRSGDNILYNQARNIVTNEIRLAKKNYSEKLKKELSAKKRSAISMDWSEEHHHVQDTTPTFGG